MSTIYITRLSYCITFDHYNCHCLWQNKIDLVPAFNKYRRIQNDPRDSLHIIMQISHEVYQRKTLEEDNFFLQNSSSKQYENMNVINDHRSEFPI